MKLAHLKWFRKTRSPTNRNLVNLVKLTIINKKNKVRVKTQKCCFCDKSRHARIKCSAKEVNSNTCGRKGYLANVCQLNPQNSQNQQTVARCIFPFLPLLLLLSPSSLQKPVQYSVRNGHKVSTLTDSRSSESLTRPDVVRK